MTSFCCCCCCCCCNHPRSSCSMHMDVISTCLESHPARFFSKTSAKSSAVDVTEAAIGGGNCELTKLNETYVTDNGVTIIGFWGWNWVWPLPRLPVTTRIMNHLRIGNPNRNLYFATVTGKGATPKMKVWTYAFDRRSSFLHGLQSRFQNSRMVVKSKGNPGKKSLKNQYLIIGVWPRGPGCLMRSWMIWVGFFRLDWSPISSWLVTRIFTLF